MSGDLAMRPIEDDEFGAFYACFFNALGYDPRDDERDLERTGVDMRRTLASFDGDQMVSTAAILTRQLTVPGAIVPVAAVTMVSVAPTHRRRGILTTMMTRQLTELHDQQAEPVAALFASEAGIYGRFGYGLAARSAQVSGATRTMQLAADVDLGPGRVQLLTAAEAEPHLRAVYESVRPSQPGWLDRDDPWWGVRLYDPEHRRQGATTLRFAVHLEPSAEATGYAVYRVKMDWNDAGPNGEVQVTELVAATTEAYAALWSFLLNLDMIRRIQWRMAAPDEAVQHLIGDPRAVQLTLADNLWVRVVDVDRALAARTYSRDIDLVLEVADPTCPWNARRWRLSGNGDGATCAPTSDPADLQLGSTDLGAAYLGGPTLSALAAAGRVREVSKGALAAASRAFGGDRAPWCLEIF